MNCSLKSRLLVGLLASLGLLLLAGSSVVFLLQRELLYRQFDRRLHSALPVVLRRLSPPPFQRPSIKGAAIPGIDFYWVRGEDSGQVIASYPADQVELPAGHEVELGPNVFFNLVLPDGRPGRAMIERHEPRDVLPPPAEALQPLQGPARPPELTIAIAANTLELRQTLQARALIIGLTAAIGMALVTVIVFWVVHRSLLPLRPLTDEIAQLQMNRLDRRIHIPGLPAEIAPLVERLNDLLQRLEEGFWREKSFTANAAHELRTPIAGIRSTLEVALSRQRPNEQYAQAIEKSFEVVLGLQRLIDSLLELARLDADQVIPNLGPIEIWSIVERQWNNVCEQAEQRRLRFVNRLPKDLVCSADRSLVQRVVANLLDNAVRYADEGGSISINSSLEHSKVWVSMTNPASELTQEDTARMFDRFWQKDVARSSTGLHYGLGLSLVRRYVEVIGGSIRAEIAEKNMLTVRIQLPACDSKTDLDNSLTGSSS